MYFDGPLFSYLIRRSAKADVGSNSSGSAAATTARWSKSAGVTSSNGGCLPPCSGIAVFAAFADFVSNLSLLLFRHYPHRCGARSPRPLSWPTRHRLRVWYRAPCKGCGVQKPCFARAHHECPMTQQNIRANERLLTPKDAANLLRVSSSWLA